jgi:hypothetical protein
MHANFSGPALARAEDVSAKGMGFPPDKNEAAVQPRA